MSKLKDPDWFVWEISGTDVFPDWFVWEIGGKETFPLYCGEYWEGMDLGMSKLNVPDWFVWKEVFSDWFVWEIGGAEIFPSYCDECWYKVCLLAWLNCEAYDGAIEG